MIELADVSLAAGKTQLMDHFSLTLPDPGLYVLTGHTGSGKSLICRLISGQLRPGGGQVRIDGSAPRSGLAGQTSEFYSEAGHVPTFNETIRDFLASELFSAGASIRTAGDYLGLLDSYFPGGISTSMATLSSGELLIVQAVLAALAPGRTAILDGHLNEMSQDAALYCWQILQSSLVEHEKFIILTSNSARTYLDSDSAAEIRLAGGLPVTLDGSVQK